MSSTLTLDSDLYRATLTVAERPFSMFVFRARPSRIIRPVRDRPEPGPVAHPSVSLAYLSYPVRASQKHVLHHTRSSKINVVPPEVTAEIDCRLLPDQDQDAFVALLHSVINDPAVRVEKIMGFTPAVSSTDSDLYRAITTVAERHFPGARVVPSISTGFADSHFLRDLGIVCYGFDPTVVPVEIEGSVHGNDERVPVASIRSGVQHLLEILELVVYLNELHFVAVRL